MLKMYELFTARYSDGRTEYEKTLDWFYKHQDEEIVEISPTIYLWKAAGKDVYYVDYVGICIRYTLKVFDDLKAAQEYREEIADMTVCDFENWLTNLRLAHSASVVPAT